MLTNMDHVEALERLRYRWAMPGECAALDAAIAVLSAPQPPADEGFTAADMADASAQGFRDGVASVGETVGDECAPAEAQPCGCGEATCTVPWEPGCGLGKSEQHAEAQGVGEALEAELIALVAGPYHYHHKMDEHAEREGKAFDRCRELTIQNIRTWCATRRAMLAAQPPSAPVGVEDSFSAADMADAAAQGFRDGVASVGAVGEGCVPAETHCATCSCTPGMTPAIRFDTTPAERDGVVRDHLIRMGWTPPAEVPVGAEDRARHLLAAALRPHDRMASDWAMEPTFDGYAVAQRDALHAIAAALAPQPPADGGFTAADMMDARQEGREEAQQPAADDVDAEQFRKGWQAGFAEGRRDQKPEAVKYAGKSGRLEAKVERLAETLQKLAAHIRPTCSVLWDEAQAALRDHDQEGTNDR